MDSTNPTADAPAPEPLLDPTPDRPTKVNGKIPAGIDPNLVDHAPAEISSPSNDPASFPPATSCPAGGVAAGARARPFGEGLSEPDHRDGEPAPAEAKPASLTTVSSPT